MSDRSRWAAELLAKRPTESTKGMHVEDRANSIEQMLLDLRKLAINDGCIAAAWAFEFALDIADELARRDAEAAERAMPITEEWLRSVGATIDVEDGVIEFRWLPGELVMTGGGFVVWTIDCVETGKFCTRGNLLDLRAALKGVEA